MTKSAFAAGTAAMAIVAFFATPQAADKSVRIHGFVVEIVSPDVVVVDDYNITIDRTLRVRLQQPSIPIHIGTELVVEGTMDSSSGELRAATVRAVAPLFERFREKAVVTTIEDNGLLRAGGRRVRLDGDSKVVFGKTLEIGSLEDVRAGMMLTYQASAEDDGGTIDVESVEFQRNETSGGEQNYRKSLKVKVTEPDFERHRAGGVRYGSSGGGYYRILANAEAQEYISELGWKLVPQFQKDLPDDDPTKIPFKFYIVKELSLGAVALPTGIVVVYSDLFATLDNEAQLASVVGHEIGHLTHEHGAH